MPTARSTVCRSELRKGSRSIPRVACGDTWAGICDAVGVEGTCKHISQINAPQPDAGLERTTTGECAHDFRVNAPTAGIRAGYRGNALLGGGHAIIRRHRQFARPRQPRISVDATGISVDATGNSRDRDNRAFPSTPRAFPPTPKASQIPAWGKRERHPRNSPAKKRTLKACHTRRRQSTPTACREGLTVGHPGAALRLCPGYGECCAWPHQRHPRTPRAIRATAKIANFRRRHRQFARPRQSRISVDATRISTDAKGVTDPSLG